MRKILAASAALALFSAVGVLPAAAHHTPGHSGGGGNNTVAPTVSPNLSGTLGSNGWYTSNVGLTWTITGTSPTLTGCASQNITADQASVTYSCTATNSAGSDTKSVSIKRDATKPTVQFETAPTNVFEGEGDPTATCSANDATPGSGLNGLCAISGYQSAIGTHTLTASVSDLAGNTALAATSSYQVVDDTTSPSISPDVTGTKGANDWYISDVVVAFDVQEPETPTSLSKTAGCAGTTVSTDQQAANYSCGATSLGGITQPVPVSVKRDTAPPTNIAFVGGPAADSQHYEGEVPAEPTCTATDATSGPASCTVSGYDDSTPGLVTLTATAVDNAGHSDFVTRTFTVLDDTTAPVITPVVTGTVGVNDWYTSNVGVSFTVTDDETPSSIQRGLSCAPTTLSTDTASETYSCTASSLGGQDTKDVTVKRDASGPTNIQLANMSSSFGSTPAPTCTATDATSDLASCVVDTAPIGSAAGTYTVTATATDNAGNTSQQSGTYTVSAWSFGGFQSPINPTALNRVKAGSSIPVKFSLSGDKGLAVIKEIKAVTTGCTGVVDPIADAETVAAPTAGQSALQYDSVTDTYTYVWKTSSTFAGSCRQLQLRLADGSTAKTANFQFVK